MTGRPSKLSPIISDSSRREFLRVAGMGSLGVAGIGLGGFGFEGGMSKSWGVPPQAPSPSPESLVAELFRSLSPTQRTQVCFDWDFIDPKRGLLRTRVANNWQITDPVVSSSFYTGRQQEMIRAIFDGMISPEWHDRYMQQMADDSGGWGSQSIALFGNPEGGAFEFVITGRHMTLRCDGNSSEHVAFGGPIFYGHAPEDEESQEHQGNVFWPQAKLANGVYEILDGKQRMMARVPHTPAENRVAFQGSSGQRSGIPVTEFSADQKEHLQKVVQSLLEPYRMSDGEEALACLKQQGGLDQCHLAFYTDDDIGKDEIWDNWRLEGPAFVWHFRGAPHVHVWVNIAADPRVELNA